MYTSLFPLLLLQSLHTCTCIFPYICRLPEEIESYGESLKRDDIMWAILALPYSDSLLQQPLSRMPLSAVLVSIQHLSLSPSTPHSLHSILLPLHATLHSPPPPHTLFLPPPPPINSLLSSLSLLLTSLLLSPTTHLSPPSVSPAVPDTSSVSVFSLPPATHTLRSPAGLALHNP